jgi:hypothetical protein
LLIHINFSSFPFSSLVLDLVSLRGQNEDEGDVSGRCALVRGPNAPETEMIGAGVDFALTARANDVTGTILIVAQK